MSTLLILVTCYLLLVTLVPTIHAADSTQSATPSAQVTPLDTSTLTPQSPQYANLIVNNLLHAFSCLAAGTSPIGQPCVDYLNGIPVVSNVNTSGGLLGAVANLNTIVIANPPIRTGQYLATIGDSLGLAKEVHAQVGGAGEGVLHPILALWQVSRNIAYVLMILIFVIIGLMVMFRTRINPQTVISLQAALPGLVIGLIMITFSYFLASLVTDTAYLATNLVGFYFQAAGASSGDQTLNGRVANENTLTIFTALINRQDRDQYTGAVDTVFNHLTGWPSNIVRWGAAILAFQYGQFLGPVAGGVAGGICLIPGLGIGGGICGTLASIIGSLVGGFAASILTLKDPPGVLGLALFIIAIIFLIFSMLRLLLKLVTNYLQIIFLTITAPFTFLIASLPGRQGLAVGWIRNMLCNVLAFPAVLAVFYFVAYLLGPDTDSSSTLFRVFAITSEAPIGGLQTLPLLGGLSLSLTKTLLAFVALVATPTIPDIICRVIGSVGPAGEMIQREYAAVSGQGQGYIGQARGGVERIGGAFPDYRVRQDIMTRLGNAAGAGGPGGARAAKLREWLQKFGW